jgi:thioredoxin 1
MFGPVVDQFVEENNVQLIKVNIDETPQIAIDNDITSIPVLILMEEDTILYRVNGAKPRPFLDKNLAPLI